MLQLLLAYFFFSSLVYKFIKAEKKLVLQKKTQYVDEKLKSYKQVNKFFLFFCLHIILMLKNKLIIRNNKIQLNQNLVYLFYSKHIAKVPQIFFSCSLSVYIS
jgi:hypothetical protein